MGRLKRMFPWCDLRSRHIVYTKKGTMGFQIKMVCKKKKKKKKKKNE